jgi:phosphoribosylformylglycinamidine cyclo-ligase
VVTLNVPCFLSWNTRSTGDLNLDGNTYSSAGVDLGNMEPLKDRIKAFSALTHGPEVLDAGGGFAGLYNLSGYENPVLISSTDGVGTKLRIAAQLGHFESVGQDLVTLNVNDILTKGAKPLFFLDYISFSHLDNQRMEMLVRGMVWGCKEVGCSLIGGETAQMPGIYSAEDFDLAGFVVGAVEREDVIDGTTVTPGDVLIGFPSSGLHTNGFSLVRKVFRTEENPSILFEHFDDLGHTLGQELLIRHRCYYPMLEPIMSLCKGFSHVTGGGLPGKIPPMLPDTVAAEFQIGSWVVPPIFDLIKKTGGVSDNEMYTVFNMGLGMIGACEEESVATILDTIPDAQVVGVIVPRDSGPQVKLI